VRERRLQVVRFLLAAQRPPFFEPPNLSIITGDQRNEHDKAVSWRSNIVMDLIAVLLIGALFVWMVWDAVHRGNLGGRKRSP